jgi:hypothetical protein
MSRTARRPLDRDAVRAADDQFYANHPELVQDDKRIPLDPSDPSQADLRSEWMDLYVANGGEVEGKAPAGDKRPDDATEPCPVEPSISARWQDTTVKCGDQAGMMATTRNIRAGTNATFTVKHISDDRVLGSETEATEATSVSAQWLSKKPSVDWHGAEVKFTVAAAGTTADSEPDQL